MKLAQNAYPQTLTRQSFPVRQTKNSDSVKKTILHPHSFNYKNNKTKKSNSQGAQPQTLPRKLQVKTRTISGTGTSSALLCNDAKTKLRALVVRIPGVPAGLVRPGRLRSRHGDVRHQPTKPNQIHCHSELRSQTCVDRPRSTEKSWRSTASSFSFLLLPCASPWRCMCCTSRSLEQSTLVAAASSSLAGQPFRRNSLSLGFVKVEPAGASQHPKPWRHPTPTWIPQFRAVAVDSNPLSDGITVNNEIFFSSLDVFDPFVCCVCSGQ